MLAAALLVFLPVNFLYGAVLTKVGPPEKNDFTSYYVAAQVVRQGRPEALYYPEPVGSLLAQASVQHPWIDAAAASGVPNPNYYLYPPFFAVALLPLTLLSYPAAFAMWLTLNVGFLAGALLLYLRSRKGATALTIAACVLFTGAFYPVWHHLKIGQSSLLVLLMLTGCLALLRRGHDGTAGIVLSGAILLKLTPAILIFFLVLRRRWRAAAAAAAGALLLSAASAAATGWQAQATYYTRMVPLLSAGTAFYPNQSFNGFLTRLMGAGDYRRADLSVDLQTPRLAAAVAGAALVAISIFAVARRRREEGEEVEEDGFATLILASLLVSPISWEHHYVLALLPAWMLARRWCAARAVPWGLPAAAGLSLALAGSYVGVAVFEKFGPGALLPLLSSAAFLGGAALWGIFVSGAAARRLPEEPEGGAPRRRVAGTAALLTMMAVFAGAQFLLKVAEYDTSFSYGDFTSYYVAAAAVLEGAGPSLYAPDTPDQILAKAESPSPWRSLADGRGVRDANYYLYPPIFAVLVSPLGLLPYGAAHDVWYLVNLSALIGFLAWHLRSGGKDLPAAEIASAPILAALLWPALFTFGAGQANYLILLLVFAALLAAEKGRDAAAGWALAAAAAVKLTPGLLVAYFLWKRRFRLVAWAAAGFAVLTLAGVAAVGWEPHRTYAGGMLPLLSRGCAHWVNQSVSALLSRLAGEDMFAWDLASPSALVGAGAAGISFLFVAALAYLTRPGTCVVPLRLEYALALVTTLFVSPISWIHHAVLSLPAVFFLLRHLGAAGRATLGRAVLLGMAFVLIGIYFKPFGFFRTPILTPLASYHLLGQILLWGILAAEILHLRRTGERGAGGSVPGGAPA